MKPGPRKASRARVRHSISEDGGRTRSLYRTASQDVNRISPQKPGERTHPLEEDEGQAAADPRLAEGVLTMFVRLCPVSLTERTEQDLK